ncbi:MAG: MFS transporter [Candidatus Dormibacteraeota bacterium]|nr:MFS transporter [Candidatus Dormibacteraeota bacterium]
MDSSRAFDRGDAAGKGRGGSVGAAQWRRNLAALWVAEFMAIFGFSFALPFLPVYLSRDLGITSTSELALWTGIAGGVSGATMALASPIWGALADRQGRKAMLVRAMVGGALAVGLMAFAHSALQLVVLRAVQGATSGTVAAATSLVGAETPRRRVAWSLGVLSSSVALGGALGPVLGGLAAQFLGLRVVFAGAGLLLLLAAVPVLIVVRESPRTKSGEARAPGPVAAVRSLGRPVLLALAVLIGGQALMQFAYASTQQLSVLRLLQLNPAAAGRATGLAFGLAGLSTTLASVLSARIARRAGYRWVGAGAALAMAGAIAAAALSGGVLGIVVAVAVFGLFYGTLSPVLASLIGLRAPRAVQSTVFGISASAIAVGFGAGPLVGGGVAAVSDARAALWVAAVVAAALAVLLAFKLREPEPPPAPTSPG